MPEHLEDLTLGQLAAFEQSLLQFHDLARECCADLDRLTDEEKTSNVYRLDRRNEIFARLEDAHLKFMAQWRESGFPLPPRWRASDCKEPSC